MRLNSLPHSLPFGNFNSFHFRSIHLHYLHIAPSATTPSLIHSHINLHSCSFLQFTHEDKTIEDILIRHPIHYVPATHSFSTFNVPVPAIMHRDASYSSFTVLVRYWLILYVLAYCYNIQSIPAVQFTSAIQFNQLNAGMNERRQAGLISLILSEASRYSSLQFSFNFTLNSP